MLSLSLFGTGKKHDCPAFGHKNKQCDSSYLTLKSNQKLSRKLWGIFLA